MYIIVTLAVRLMGKRQIGDMQPNELVVTLLISELAAIPLQDSNQPLLSGAAAIFVLVIAEITVSVAAMKSLKLRGFLCGKSVVIIKNGALDQKALKRVRMTVLDLTELLRQSGVFDINEVAFAVLEVNGGLSVLKKSEYDTPNRRDMKIKTKPETLLLPVVCDGRIIDESLSALSLSRSDLTEALSGEGFRASGVFLMLLDKEKTARIIGKRDEK